MADVGKLFIFNNMLSGVKPFDIVMQDMQLLSNTMYLGQMALKYRTKFTTTLAKKRLGKNKYLGVRICTRVHNCYEYVHVQWSQINFLHLVSNSKLY